MGHDAKRGLALGATAPFRRQTRSLVTSGSVDAGQTDELIADTVALFQG
ncbi:MAG: hypothetical protein ACRDOI_26640 [Trebonia sp.]